MSARARCPSPVSCPPGSPASPCTSHRSYKYLWADGVKVKTAIECSAPEYVEYLMTWCVPFCYVLCPSVLLARAHSSPMHCCVPPLRRVESQLNDEAIFPIQADGVFPKNFQAVSSLLSCVCLDLLPLLPSALLADSRAPQDSVCGR